MSSLSWSILLTFSIVFCIFNEVNADCKYTGELTNEFGEASGKATCSVLSSNCIAQSYVASTSGWIVAIETIATVTGTSQMKLQLLNSSQQVIFTSQNVAVSSSNTIIRVFDVSPPIYQTAGSTYYINPQAVSALAIKVDCYTNNPFPNGTQAKVCGTTDGVLTTDYLFRVVLESFDDTDSDGTRDCEDDCPTNPLLVTPKTLYRDLDGDGYGNATDTISTCLDSVVGYTTSNTDCNDNCNLCFPGQTFYQDLDNDKFGSNVTTIACTIPLGYVRNNKDCNDSNSNVNPNATEICDHLDNNCNYLIDENVTTQFYRDFDNDGFGNISISIWDCTPPAGYVRVYGDCNNTNSAIHPNATEVCDFIDNNCDGFIDENLLVTFYQDADQDGFGNNSIIVETCFAPAGYTNIGGDCNDTAAAINPNAVEICDYIDNNCNAEIDEGLWVTSYLDSDRDTYGNASTSFTGCTVPTNYVLNSDDCDDFNANVHPNMVETCNDIDDNCNSIIDELVKITYYVDNDNDAYGNSSDSILACTLPVGYVGVGGDCNDTDPLVKGKVQYRSNTINETTGDYEFVLACYAPVGFSLVSELNGAGSGGDTAAVGVGAGIGSVVGILIVVLILVLYRKRKNEEIGRKRLESVSSNSSNAWMGTVGSLGRKPSGFEITLDSESMALLDVFSGKWQINRDWIDLKECIGEGEFGKVYVAFLNRPGKDDAESPTKVAVKMVHSDATLKERNDFLREASIMKDFSHDNVIRLVGAVTSDPSKVLIVIEFAHHGDLKKYIRASEIVDEAYSAANPNSPLSTVTVAQMMSFAADIARGMEYLASLHFVHRDLAARNCMIAEPEPGKLVCKVADFGMSRDIYESDYYKKAGTDKVPLRWMAPEALSLRKYSEKTDVWSYGITCFEIFSVGALPYGSVPTSDLLDYLLAGKRISRPRGCPFSMYTVMSVCWQTNPQNRPRFSTIAKAMSEAEKDYEIAPPSLSKYTSLGALPSTFSESGEGELSDVSLTHAMNGDFSQLTSSVEGKDQMLRGLHGGSHDSLSNIASPAGPINPNKSPSSPTSNEYYLTQDAQFSPMEARARLASITPSHSSAGSTPASPALNRARLASVAVASDSKTKLNDVGIEMTVVPESESPYVVPQDTRIMLEPQEGSAESAYLNDAGDAV